MAYFMAALFFAGIVLASFLPLMDLDSIKENAKQE